VTLLVRKKPGNSLDGVLAVLCANHLDCCVPDSLRLRKGDHENAVAPRQPFVESPFLLCYSLYRGSNLRRGYVAEEKNKESTKKDK